MRESIYLYVFICTYYVCIYLWSLTHRLTTINGISLQLAVFPQYTLITIGQTDRQTDPHRERTRNSVCKNRQLTLLQIDAA